MGALLISSEPRLTAHRTPNVSPLPLTEEGRKENEKGLANSSYEVVISILPNLVDSQKIQEVLEEAKRNINVAVFKAVGR